MDRERRRFDSPISQFLFGDEEESPSTTPQGNNIFKSMIQTPS